MQGFPFLATPGRSVPKRRHPRNPPWDVQVLIGIVILLMLIPIAGYGYHYSRIGRYLVSTDDATVQAASVIISPAVSGHIVEVLVRDNQPVHAGQVLARMDDRDYRITFAAAQANVQAAQAAINCVQLEIEAQRLVLSQAHATVTADQAAITFTQEQSGRHEQIARVRGGAPKDVPRRSDDILQEKAALARDTATMDLSEKQAEALKATLARAQATLLQRQMALRQADLNLSYTTIASPISGTIGVWTPRVGQYVQPGTRLTVVVPLDSVYVIANYKETQITDIQQGQPVAVAVDMLPGTFVHGTVDSIAPATEEEFALLSTDNDTGNSSKTVRHVPVKIMIDPSDPLLGQLRPGMTVEPTINTHA
jgi:membrane fusion protein (multidrug efflux system)